MESTTQQRGGLIRQIHRLMAVLFTLSVIATTVALMQAEPVVWVSYIPLFPLALLFCTGAYMFVLPLRSR
jgi:ABC-type polysaccharide/polyol phosphate export permease